MTSLQILKSKFRNKRILITGHTGFKGSWLTQIFLLLDAKIMGISLPKENNNLCNILNIKERIVHKEFDLSKNLNFRKYVKEFDPHYLFHLAAQSLVINSIQDPYYTFRNNINSSLNILECAKEIRSLKSIIFVSSDKC
jgi:CDP-glucose 4,6-dehydratase